LGRRLKQVAGKRLAADRTAKESMSNDVASYASAAKSSKVVGLERLPLPALRIPEASKVEAYCIAPGSTEPKLLWARDFKLTPEHLAELKSRGFHSLWTTPSDAERVAEALRSQKKLFLCSANFTASERFALLQFTASTELDSSFRMVRCQRYVEACQRLCPDLIAALFSAPASPTDVYFSALRGTTAATRFPVLAGYAALLARATGVERVEELVEIAIGAMIHDVGARRLGAEAVVRGGRGSEEEQAAFRAHPLEAYVELLNLGTLSRRQLLMAYQHHERIDGGGFPVGVLGDEMHPWARMLAVADRFDSLTVGRQNQRALRIVDAIERMQEEAGTNLDAEAVRCWASLFTTR
jgi:response regulator RpfG family c-di-GMP phosphodiesterase